VAAISVNPKAMPKVFRSILFSGSRVEIQGDKGIHHVEAGLFPNWIGADQEHLFEFSGDRLSLSTSPYLVSGIQQTGHMVWERA
jgi:hypothetical protein